MFKLRVRGEARVGGGLTLTLTLTQTLTLTLPAQEAAAEVREAARGGGEERGVAPAA